MAVVHLHNFFKSIDKLADASYDELIIVDEIGEKIAQSIIDYFKDDKNILLLENLKRAGVAFQMKDEQGGGVSGILEGKSIVISGVFEKYSRDELKELIENNGGRNAGSVTAKTDYLLAGDKTGPAKMEKARKFDTKIISEDEFLELVKVKTEEPDD